LYQSGKACLFYQIGKCLAPCEDKISQEEYQKIIDKALYYIYNKTKLVEDIKIKMEKLSGDFRFEEAMVLRDRIKTIEKSELKSTLDFANFENIDLFAVQIDGLRGVVVKMFIRDGKLISASHNFINTTEITELEDIYKTAIVNYYANEIPTVPNEIILPMELKNNEELENFIVSRFGKKIALNTPKVGKKKELILMALRNCDELLKIDNNLYK